MMGRAKDEHGHFIAPFPGSGPWRILENCPSPQIHNTRQAAMGKGRFRQRCVCPRALALLAIMKEERRRAWIPKKQRAGRPQEPAYMNSPYRQPDLLGGLCLRPGGRKIMTAAMNIKPSPEETVAAKLMCRSCPMREVCKNWVLTAEEPAGGWGGIFAGMSPDMRRKARNSGKRASEVAVNQEGASALRA